ncbi:MAG: ATP phosphoribosyltransferase regulatory subunit [Raoultibacter sp.]|jgi:ATP phosphoribosyltransferase
MNFVTPAGFRDIMGEEARQREEITAKVQAYFSERGYALIETPTLEVLDVLQVGARMSQAPFKFFDSQGDLLAMRPDVTTQVARMCATRLKDQPGPFKFRYMQRVFRETDGEMQATAREMTQFGIESIGADGCDSDAEMLGIFADVLTLCGLKDFRLAIGTVAVLRSLLETSQADDAWKNKVLAAYHSSNFVELDRLVDEVGSQDAYAQAIKALPCIRGGRKAIEKVRALVDPLGCSSCLDAFEQTYSLLEEQGIADRLLVDFSVMSSFDYYTGIVVEAYADTLGTPLGSGGRYDNMLAAYGQSRPASGFAFYLESVMAAITAQENRQANQVGQDTARPLRIAVPKGSLNSDSIRVLQEAGLDTSGLEDPGRQLIIRNPGVEYIIVRPTDAPVFVALGAADCGICGKDSLLEADHDVVELVDLSFGACRFIVAEPEGASSQVEEHYRKLGSIRIATKYPNITQEFYAKKGMQVEIVKLHGNIELAPLTGMAERIVDITATGTTLKENNLIIVDEVLSSTARFFANPCAFRTDARIVELAQQFQESEKE